MSSSRKTIPLASGIVFRELDMVHSFGCHGISRSAPCRALEKQFHLPAVLVDGRNRRRAEAQQIGEKHNGHLFLRVPNLYSPEQHGIFPFPSQSGKADDPVLFRRVEIWDAEK